LQSFVLIIDLGAIIKHDDEKAGNICVRVRTMPRLEARNTRGTVFKAGKVDIFPALNYSVLALPYFQSRKRHSRRRDGDSLRSFK